MLGAREHQRLLPVVALRQMDQQIGLAALVDEQHTLIDGRDRRIARRDIDRHRLVEQRSEEHTSELQSLMRISYAVFCLKKKKKHNKYSQKNIITSNKRQTTVTQPMTKFINHTIYYYINYT